MKTLILSLLVVLLAVPPLFGASTDEVKKISKEKITKVISLLRDKSLSKEARNENILKEVNPLLDFDQMAKLSLGKKHWLGMNPEQRQRFLNLFVERLQESYLEKLDLYTDEDVVVEDAVQVKSRIHVTTQLVTKDDKKEMIYKFYQTKTSGWMVYDVEILGVSVVQTYRSQFEGLLKDTDYEGLLARLGTKGGIVISTDRK